MRLRRVVFLFLVPVLFSGCATNSDTLQNTPKNAVQNSSTGPTVSGYIDVGAGKSLH
jgi:uncharacterized lipoprotein YajG